MDGKIRDWANLKVTPFLGRRVRGPADRSLPSLPLDLSWGRTGWVMIALETVAIYNAAGLSPQRPGPNIPRPRERGTNLQLETKPVYRRSKTIDLQRKPGITECKSVDQCDRLHLAAPRPRLCLTCHHKPKRKSDRTQKTVDREAYRHCDRPTAYRPMYPRIPIKRQRLRAREPWTTYRPNGRLCRCPR